MSVASARIQRAVESILRHYLPPTRRKVGFIRFFSHARAKLLGLLFGTLTQGIATYSVEGKATPLAKKIDLPAGPLVVVANHASHVDAAALVAMLGRTRPVLVAAAADYWLADPISEMISRGLIGIWPVRRGDEEGLADLLAAAELVRAGVVIVVFAEGTRSKTAALGEFHSGAFRLAEAAGAEVLPIAIRGTREILPRGAQQLTRGPINLRLLEPAVNATPEQTRESLAKALSVELKSPPGAAWQRAHRVAFGWFGLALLFTWSLAEGVFWPFIAEMPLILLIGTVGRSWRGLWLILATALGSMTGILLTWWLTKNGLPPVSPLTTDRMFETARTQMLSNPDTAFYKQMWNGIPVKVYAAEAGSLQFGFEQLAGSLVPRILRISIIGLGAWGFGIATAKWLKPCLGALQAISLTLFVLGLGLAVWYWS